MAKQEPPKVETDAEKLSKLSADEMKSELAKFQEALKSDTFKDLNTYEAIGLEEPKPEPSKEEKDEATNKATIERLLPAYTKSREELIKAGYDLSEKETKMSDGEKEIHERLEKQALAKFAEQKSEVLKIDPDYPVKDIEDLPISTDDKVAIMTSQKAIAERNTEAVKKVQEELTKTSGELKEVKMSAPGEEDKPAPDGEGKIKEALAKMGAEFLDPVKEEKVEDKNKSKEGNKKE